MGMLERGPAKQLLGRRLRRSLNLADEDEICSLWAGPPEVSFDNRSDLLARLRVMLSAEGGEIVNASPGFVEIRFFRKEPVHQLFGREAAQQLEIDEQTADQDMHWWLHDVTWALGSGEGRIFSGVDPDGNDLFFLGWGDPSALGTMARIEELLLAPRPA
jgi:hypothetical protein